MSQASLVVVVGGRQVMGGGSARIVWSAGLAVTVMVSTSGERIYPLRSNEQRGMPGRGLAGNEFTKTDLGTKKMSFCHDL